VELVRTPVDVILTHGSPATRAAKQATSTIPIVMVGAGDPVGTAPKSGQPRWRATA
jgi:putative ABC transport system substrate-binding protein